MDFSFFIGEPLTAAEYAQDLIKGELTQRLFGVTQKIHKKLAPETGLDEGEESVFPRYLAFSHVFFQNLPKLLYFTMLVV